jgi:hypothetical protein
MRMNISVPDALAEEVRQRNIPISAICQRALRDELDRLGLADQDVVPMEKITVEVGEPALTTGFIGRWLVMPGRDETRTGEEGYDAGAYWGIALTQKHRIAVYTAHCNDRWAPVINDYDTLDDAAEDVPEDIIALAAAELGEQRVIWRDI